MDKLLILMLGNVLVLLKLLKVRPHIRSSQRTVLLKTGTEAKSAKASNSPDHQILRF